MAARAKKHASHSTKLAGKVLAVTSLGSSYRLGKFVYDKLKKNKQFKCSRCDSMLDEGERFCNQCGAPAREDAADIYSDKKEEMFELQNTGADNIQGKKKKKKKKNLQSLEDPEL